MPGKKKEPSSDSESEGELKLSRAQNQQHIMKEIKQTFAQKGPKDFQKIRILGKGGVGRVYLARLKGTDKYYAMKVLKQDEMIKRNKVKRVLTEREILATTDYPFIISLYYSFQSRSRLYFVMDYCAGGEFYHTIQMQPHKCLTEDQMRFYAAEVLLALEYLHVMGFVYRDLKPENILLHESGHIRLTDFDLSKASVTPVNAHLVQSMMSSTPTLVAEPSLVTNSFVGTEEYLAPEVIEGKGYGASVDWWTFGILMFEMLYGVTPFRGKSQHDTFHRIGKSVVKFPEHKRCAVSKECKNLIKKLLSHDPKKRIGSLQGAAEIKAHPFFSKIQWSLMLNETPPIIPVISDITDFRYFSSTLKDDDKDDSDLELVDPSELDPSHPFKTFGTIDKQAESKKKSDKNGPTSSIPSHPSRKTKTQDTKSSSKKPTRSTTPVSPSRDSDTSEPDSTSSESESDSSSSSISSDSSSSSSKQFEHSDPEEEPVPRKTHKSKKDSKRGSGTRVKAGEKRDSPIQKSRHTSSSRKSKPHTSKHLKTHSSKHRSNHSDPEGLDDAHETIDHEESHESDENLTNDTQETATLSTNGENDIPHSLTTSTSSISSKSSKVHKSRTNLPDDELSIPSKPKKSEKRLVGSSASLAKATLEEEEHSTIRIHVSASTSSLKESKHKSRSDKHEKDSEMHRSSDKLHKSKGSSSSLASKKSPPKSPAGSKRSSSNSSSESDSDSSTD